MRLLRGFVWLFGAMALFAACAASVASAADGLPESICWRQNAFSIPFNVAPAQSADQQPREIRLYVSTNEGTRWDLVQSVSPQSGNFVFRAPSDGQYWFIIRTVDAQGRVLPQEGGPPELRVIVDTAVPRLELSASRGESGEIKTQWRAVDPLLNADSLKIEYQSTDGKWRSVAVDRPRGDGDRSTTTGTLTWWPNDAPAGVTVRVEISDRAGNVAVAQAKAEAVAGPSHGDLTAKAPPQRTSTPSSTGGFNGAGQSPFVPPLAQNSATPWPADHATGDPLGRSLTPADNSGPASYLAQRTDWPPAAGANVGDWNRRGIPATPAAAASDAMEDQPNPPIRSQATPSDAPRRRSRDRVPSDSPLPQTAAAPIDPQLPSGQRPRMVNSKSFELDYEVDAVGPSGIAKVELWGTRDGGRTWTSYGVDNDNRSPIRATADGEGVYGFRITVQSGSGLGGLPPRSGDQPELWVEVDMTQPVMRLISAEGGADEQAGELLIRWEASDAALAVRPITLLFSDRRGGPWSIIAGGLENSGRYAWRPDNRVPDQIYLRIEARDEAGNTAAFEAAEPVSVERIRPEGRIRGVRPVNNSALRPQIYQFFR